MLQAVRHGHQRTEVFYESVHPGQGHSDRKNGYPAKTETGLTVYLKKIPVRQEIIEVCEYFGLNPYQLQSNGCYLMVATDGDEVVFELQKQQIHAAVIGKLTDSNDKIIRNGEEVRYIDRPAPDEIKKLYYGKLNIRD